MSFVSIGNIMVFLLCVLRPDVLAMAQMGQFFQGSSRPGTVGGRPKELKQLLASFQQVGRCCSLGKADLCNMCNPADVLNYEGVHVLGSQHLHKVAAAAVHYVGTYTTT